MTFPIFIVDAVANSLQYECIYQVTDDYPPHSDATNVIFKAGDRIIQVCTTYCSSNEQSISVSLCVEFLTWFHFRLVIPRYLCS